MVEKSHTAGWWPQVYEPLRHLSERVADWFAPRSEASAVKDCYEISLELPGVKVVDIDVSTHDNHLVIKGEKRAERKEVGRSYFFSEREYGAFQRTFRLPPDADQNAIAADYRDGVLLVRVPKAGPPPEKKTRIEVRAG